jgi:hypothetical protein
MDYTTQRLLVPYDEAREQLGGIGRSKFYELVAAGELTKVCLGSRVFVTADSIRALVERSTAGAAS